MELAEYRSLCDVGASICTAPTIYFFWRFMVGAAFLSNLLWTGVLPGDVSADKLARSDKGTRMNSAAPPIYTVTALGTLPECSDNSPEGINAHGQITGTAYFANDRNHSYFWEQGRLISLGTLGGTQCNASAINDSGQVVGQSEDAQGPMLAFVWQNGQMKALDTPGAQDSYAESINNKGQIVGSATMANRRSHPLLWDKDGAHDLTRLLPKNSTLRSINDNGQILGLIVSAKGYGLLLDKGQVTRIRGHADTYAGPMR